MSPLTVYKLVILHMLSRTEGKMQASYLAFLLLENGYANRVNLALTFGELEERELVEITDEDGRSFVRITQAGREALHYFGDDLSMEIEQQADRFLSDHGLIR